jgi:hypothetical protein
MGVAGDQRHHRTAARPGPATQLFDTVAAGSDRGHRRPATHHATPGREVQGALRAPPHSAETKVQPDSAGGAGHDTDGAVTTATAPASGTDGTGASVTTTAAAAQAGRPSRAGDKPPPEATTQRSARVIDQCHLHGNPSNQAGVSAGWYIPVDTSPGTRETGRHTKPGNVGLIGLLARRLRTYYRWDAEAQVLRPTNGRPSDRGWINLY